MSIDHYKTLNVCANSSDPRHCDHDDEWVSIESLAAGAENFAGMIVQSRLMRKLVTLISRLAPYKGTVLIQGESGTGKELVAHALHRLGPLPKGPFVTFNCSNLVGSLAEAQLFGHVRGAFTDAREESLGYFRSADGGTLFLDEIGELPMALQPKFLRATETFEVQPVGSAKTYKVNVRLVAATNRDLRAMIKAGEFREDLYYRLNAANIHIPPLRDRREGIAALTAHVVECYNRLFDKQVRLISRRALELLESSPWPGNVRELANTILSAVILTEGDRLCIADFPQLTKDEASTAD
jgi:transcriptional regulator with GAF, ATPase, and Fis domain